MKIAIKIKILLFFLTFVFNLSFGQSELKKFDFEMDKAIYDFRAELTLKKVDTLLQAYYTFDNGRGNNATHLFFWRKNGKDSIKVIKTKKKNKFKEFPIKECSEFTNILDFYFNNETDIKATEPTSKMWFSHNYGYFIKLNLNNSEYKTYLRNEKRFDDKEHLKSQWINLIDNIAKEYIEK
ncbi:hypothetical protein [Lacinutrix sp. MEBiC02404]